MIALGIDNSFNHILLKIKDRLSMAQRTTCCGHAVVVNKSGLSSFPL